MDTQIAKLKEVFPLVPVPTRVAEMLGIWPKLPENAVVKEFETPGGIVKMSCLAEAIEVQANY